MKQRTFYIRLAYYSRKGYVVESALKKDSEEWEPRTQHASSIERAIELWERTQFGTPHLALSPISVVHIAAKDFEVPDGA